jgi:hypothetical protein
MKLGAYKAGLWTNENTKDKYIATSGQGYDYTEGEGRFSVKYGDDEDEEEKEFTNFLEAVEFYESIDGVAALWDFMDLLELKEINPNYKEA